MSELEQESPALTRFSIVIPTRDEEGCIASTVQHLHLELQLHHVPHEIIVVDDDCKDATFEHPANRAFAATV